MKHERHYSTQEANATLGWVQEVLDGLREARLGLNDEEARAALTAAAPTNGGGAPGTVVSEAFLALRDGLMSLQEKGVVLRDLERGLVDFPSLREDQEIYLCWEEGEQEVAFWHDLEDGHAGRRPL